jgi:N-methylhydantoinase B
MPQGQSKAKIDPVTLEVIRNALPAIANEMAADLQRTSYNMMIYEVRDFCTAVLAPDGALICQNVGGVSHFVADLGVIVEDGVKRYGKDGFQNGDVIITNHQAVAGQHLNNIVIYTPYIRDGELLCFAMVRAHWIDVGGVSTGFGGGTRVTDPWMEGLQLDQLKIYEGGKPNDVLIKVIRDNIRFPDASFGDMRSQVAACKLASRRLDELFDKYGRDTILESIKIVFDESEQKCRNVVAAIPDGIYEAESWIDDDGLIPDDPVRIHARVTIEGSDMTIDLSGCSGERKSAINARTLAAARVAYKALTTPVEPVNEGSFTALKLIIPEGNIMMARYPAPMSGWSHIVPTVVDTIIAALAPAWPSFIPAAHSGLLGGSVAFFGNDPKTGKRFVVQSIEGGGWGGRPEEDGESGTVSVCQGDVRNATIESIELKCPVVIEERALRPNSGGAGKNRGGMGIDLRVRNLVEGRWNLPRTERNKCRPWGQWGGMPSGGAAYFLKQPGENGYKLMNVHRHPVPANSTVIVRTSGGGGWGDPLDREAERVQADVMDGLVTLDAARDLYGVILDAKTFAIDAKATETQRAKLRKQVRTDDQELPIRITQAAAE